MAGQERRPGVGRRQAQKYPRLPLHVPVTSKPLDRRGAPLVGESQNLSQGGIQLRLPRGVVPGTLIRVTLDLQGQAPLALTGRVIWSRPHPDLPGWTVGVQFAEPLAEHHFLALMDEERPSRERLPWLEEIGATAS